MTATYYAIPKDLLDDIVSVSDTTTSDSQGESSCPANASHVAGITATLADGTGVAA